MNRVGKVGQKFEINIDNSSSPSIYLSCLLFIQTTFSMLQHAPNSLNSRSNGHRIRQHFVWCCYVGNNFLFDARFSRWIWKILCKEEKKTLCTIFCWYQRSKVELTHLGRIQNRPWKWASLSAVLQPSQIKGREKRCNENFSVIRFSSLGFSPLCNFIEIGTMKMKLRLVMKFCRDNDEGEINVRVLY